MQSCHLPFFIILWLQELLIKRVLLSREGQCVVTDSRGRWISNSGSSFRFLASSAVLQNQDYRQRNEYHKQADRDSDSKTILVVCWGHIPA
jgi:hypothetical protein